MLCPTSTYLLFQRAGQEVGRPETAERQLVDADRRDGDLFDVRDEPGVSRPGRHNGEQRAFPSTDDCLKDVGNRTTVKRKRNPHSRPFTRADLVLSPLIEVMLSVIACKRSLVTKTRVIQTLWKSA